MEFFLYDDDVENDQNSIRRIAKVEESLNRTLLYNQDKNLSCKNYSYFMYILSGSIIVVVIIALILVLKHLI